MVSAKLKFLPFLIFLLGYFKSYSQENNLIPNGSFEIISSDSIYKKRFIAAPWNGYPPLYVNGLDMRNKPVGDNIRAQDGDYMIGIRVPFNECGTIISVELKQPLIAGIEYTLSFYYRPNENNYKPVDINCCFSEFIDFQANEPYQVNDTLYCHTFIPEKGNKEWKYYEFKHIANGHEKYFWMYSYLKLKKDLIYFFLLDNFKLYINDKSGTIR